VIRNLGEPKVTSKVDADRGRFRKGRAKTGGRRRGTPNRATRAAKEFLADIVNRTDVQDAIRQRILKGDTAAFFKAVEHVIGKPRQSVDVAQTGPITLRWRSE
jgi:hypothetical protein